MSLTGKGFLQVHGHEEGTAEESKDKEQKQAEQHEFVQGSSLAHLSGHFFHHHTLIVMRGGEHGRDIALDIGCKVEYLLGAMHSETQGGTSVFMPIVCYLVCAQKPCILALEYLHEQLCHLLDVLVLPLAHRLCCLQ